MKLGTETGSFVNHVLTADKQITPEIGMGCTICMWSDRIAGTIVKITPKSITVKEDTSIRIDNNGMSEVQEYKYIPDAIGSEHVFRLRNTGYRDRRGSGIIIGYRNAYYDYSF